MAMSANSHSGNLPPLDLARWRNVPEWLIGGGLALCVLGALLNLKQFGYSWLLGFMFYLSLVLGAAFLVMMHHLFDASWSVGIRRFCEHLACLVFPWMAVLFLPVAYGVGPVLGGGLLAIWLAQVGYRAMQAGCYAAMWHRGRWAQIRV